MNNVQNTTPIIRYNINDLYGFYKLITVLIVYSLLIIYFNIRGMLNRLIRSQFND